MSAQATVSWQPPSPQRAMPVWGVRFGEIAEGGAADEADAHALHEAHFQEPLACRCADAAHAGHRARIPGGEGAQRDRRIRGLVDCSAPRFPAFGARSEDLHAGALGRKVLLCADVFLDFVQAFVDEFDQVSALEADQVVVVGPAEGFFIA